MDITRFDAFTRSLAQDSVSRREAVKRLAGGALGVLLTRLGLEHAAAGTRLGGAPCTRDDQCRTGTCLGSGKCSCSPTVGCKQPPNPCKRADCDNGRCGIQNKANGSACPDDGDPCTRNVCDKGACTHPPKKDGATCGTGLTCCGGACRAGACPPPCAPTTCSELGRACGPVDDGCGGQLECGTCKSGTCRSDGTCGGCPDGQRTCPGKTGCFDCCVDTDCCPPDGDALHDRCLSRSTPPRWKGCSEGACTCDVYDADHRLDCGSPTGPCQQCCTNDDCVAKFSDPNRVCTVTAGNASCTCPSTHPELCPDRSSPTRKYVCTDTSSNMDHCGFCGNWCNPALHTRCEGQCLP